jgi:hypothetical protein
VTSDLSDASKAYIQLRIDSGDESVRGWVMRGVILHMLSIGGALFIMGNINANISDALEQVKQQQKILDARAVYIEDSNRWRESLTEWAKKRGFRVPSKPMENIK